MADLDGFEQMLSALIEKKLQVLRATPEGLDQAAGRVKANIQEELSRSSHPPGTPTPSPPGSPPSLVTGNLRRSIAVDGPARVGEGRWMAEIGSDLVYAAIQEHGGQAGNGATLPPRPYIAPALIRSRGDIAAALNQAWAAALA